MFSTVQSSNTKSLVWFFNMLVLLQSDTEPLLVLWNSLMCSAYANLTPANNSVPASGPRQVWISKKMIEVLSWARFTCPVTN